MSINTKVNPSANATLWINSALTTVRKKFIVFSIFVVWCNLSSYHTAKLLVRNIIWALWVDCVKQFGFCITILHLVQIYSCFVTISLKLRRVSLDLESNRLVSMWYLAIPKTQENTPGIAFRVDGRDKQKSKKAFWKKRWHKWLPSTLI